MLTGTTSSGFNWEIEADALDDMELLDALTAIDAGEKDKVSVACLRLLGKTPRTALYNHLRDENGRVRISAVANELGEIMLGLSDGKKS